MDKRVVKSAQYNKRRAYPNNCNFTAISSKTTASKLSLRQNLTLYMSKFRQNDTQNRIYRSFLTIIGRYSWLGFWLNNIMFYLQLKMVKFLDGICTMHYWCWNGRFKKSQTSFFCLFFSWKFIEGGHLCAIGRGVSPIWELFSGYHEGLIFLLRKPPWYLIVQPTACGNFRPSFWG